MHHFSDPSSVSRPMSPLPADLLSTFGFRKAKPISIHIRTIAVRLDRGVEITG